MITCSMEVHRLLGHQDPFEESIGSNGRRLPKHLAMVLHLMDQTFSRLPDSCGKNLNRVVVKGKLYFIGAQLARLVHRSPYNLYRSMRNHGVVYRTYSWPKANQLSSSIADAVTHSRCVTLVELESVLHFFYHNFQRTQTGFRKSIRPARIEYKSLSYFNTNSHLK